MSSRDYEIGGVFAICGKANAGKTTIANILQDKLTKLAAGGVLDKNITVRKVAFADALKEVIAKTFDITVDEIEAIKRDANTCATLGNHTLSVRKLLQRFGTEAMRGTFGDNFWTDYLITNIRGANNIAIIDDCRFVNELDSLDAAFGVDKVCTIMMRYDPDIDSNHPSECGIVTKNDGYFDIVFDNNGHKLNLDSAANKIVEYYMRDFIRLPLIQ